MYGIHSLECAIDSSDARTSMRRPASIIWIWFSDEAGCKLDAHSETGLRHFLQKLAPILNDVLLQNGHLSGWPHLSQHISFSSIANSAWQFGQSGSLINFCPFPFALLRLYGETFSGCKKSLLLLIPRKSGMLMLPGYQ